MVNRERLIDLRELNGLSRKELANQLSITEQTVWQYEQGLIEPSFLVLRKLTDLFSVNPDYFFSSENIPHVAVRDRLTYRTKKNQPTKPDKYELKYIDYIHYYVKYLNQFVMIKHLDLKPIQKDINRYYQSFMTYEEHMEHIEDWASEVRQEFQIENNKKLMYTLEQYGIYILERELPEEKDAYSIWVEDIPYIVLNRKRQSEARRTYSLAHELGHLLMHRDIDISELNSTEYNNLEKEANQFASCFLLPKDEIEKDFISIDKPSNPKSYIKLKEKYHVSIAAIEYRCYNLGLLNANQNSYFYKLMNKYRYRVNEPLDDEWSLTIPGKLMYMFRFILENGISKDEILASNSVKGEFLEKLFGLRKSVFSNFNTVNKEPIKTNY